MIKENTDIKSSARYPWLDAIRFIAAFFVLVGHTRNDFFMTYGTLPSEQQGILSFLFYSLGRLGHEAVIAFFVISGFLVGGRGFDRILKGTFDRTSYTIDRTVRIGIPLVAAIVFCCITYKIIGKEYSYWTVLGNLFSLQGIFCGNLISPFWSLAVEVWFYIMLFGISLLVEKNLSGLIVTFVCFLVFVKLGPYYLLLWMMGAFAYLCKPAGGGKRWILYTSFIGVCISCALSLMGTDSGAVILPFKPNRELMGLCMSFFMCLFIQQVILVQPKNQFAKKINAGFSNLADFSYTLYLTHRVTLLLIFKYLYEENTAAFDGQGLLRFAIILGICLVVSWLIYLLSEKHTSRVKLLIKNYLEIK